MTCAKCGAGTTIVETPPARDEGEFTEEWECSNGHKGYVSGREEESPTKWDRYGAVFES